MCKGPSRPALPGKLAAHRRAKRGVSACTQWKNEQAHTHTHTRCRSLSSSTAFTHRRSHLQHREPSSRIAQHPSCSQASSQCEAGCTPTPPPGSFPAGGSVRGTKRGIFMSTRSSYSIFSDSFETSALKLWLTLSIFYADRLRVWRHGNEYFKWLRLLLIMWLIFPSWRWESWFITTDMF